MSTRAAAVLHNAEVGLQSLVTRRLAMVAANHAAEVQDQPIPYGEEHFDALAAEIRASCWVDPTEFPS